MAKSIFAFSLENQINRITKVIMVHDLNQKNLHINGLYFCKIKKNPILGVFLGIIPNIIFFTKNLSRSAFYP